MSQSAAVKEAVAAPALAVEGLTAGYSAQPILHDVSAAFQAGEITAVIGPNGAGKSTLLKAVFGLASVHRGTIYLHGKPISGSTRTLVQQGVAYVPQVNNVFPTLSVRENLEVGTYVRSAEHAMERALELFPDLVDLLKKRAGQLSGGQRSMLATARALVSDPTVLLVDEASAGLAPLVAQRLWKQLHESSLRGVAVVVVEQNVALALEYSSKVFLLSGGRTKFEGTPGDLSARPDFEDLFFDAVGSPDEIRVGDGGR
jgi:ABC-type branched-subunit amino acid transport system ATPase component